MSQRPPLNQSPARVSRRHDRHGGYDLTDIYEARLLAQGVTANEFVAKRSAADLSILPTLYPTRIGRGSPEWEARLAAKAKAEAEVQPPQTEDLETTDSDTGEAEE